MLDKDDELLQAYLCFKKRDYSACLREMESDAFDKESIAVQHNQSIVSFLRDNSKNYDDLYRSLDCLLKRIQDVPNENAKSSLLSISIIKYNMAVLLSLQQRYDETVALLSSILEENRKVESSIQLRCYLLLVEAIFSIYRIRGETKEWLHEKCYPAFTQIETLLKEPFPDFVKNRIQFRYHIFRTLYFLEQGSVKGVKKEVKSSSDFYLLFSADSPAAYLDRVRDSLQSQSFLYTLALDGLEPTAAIDGYLPSLLKTRLEFRRGNWSKILSVLNQVYEEDARFPGAAPAKDSFYYTMLSSVYCSSGMLHLARHTLARAVQLAQAEGADRATLGTLLKNLSLLCLMLHDLEPARQHLRQALRLLPDNPVLWFRYAETCRLLAADATAAVPVPALRDGLPMSTRARAPTHSVSYLCTMKEAVLGYTTAVELFAARRETTTLVAACRLQLAAIQLETKQYEACLEQCEALTTLAALAHDEEPLTEEEVALSKAEIRVMAALYASECYFATRRLDKAIEAISPSSQPHLYPPLIVSIAAEPALLEQRGDELEQAIREGGSSHVEQLIYNMTLLCIHQGDWDKGKLYCDILSHFQASIKNARMRVYLLQQMGKQREARKAKEDYLMKC